MLPQIADFKAEADDLNALLSRLADADFERTTAFKAWTINDVLRHLHFGDAMALAALDSTEAFRSLRASVQARKAAGLSTRDEARERLGHLAGHALRQMEELTRLHGHDLCELAQRLRRVREVRDWPRRTEPCA